jgi:glycosyltransferase 2 family protein
LSTRRRQYLLTGVAALGGLVLFAYAVRSVGLSPISDGIRRVGWGLVPILALGGIRFGLRTQAWRLCMRPGTRLPMAPAFAAFLAGDAIGSVTPLGLAASEPTKAFLARHHLATADAVSSLATDNLVYAASALAMVGVGVVVLLATVPLPFEFQEWGVAALVLLAAAVAAGLRLLRGTWSPEQGPRPAWRERLAGIRQSVLGFSAANRTQLWQAFGLGMAFHTLAVIEVFYTLGWITPDGAPTISQSVIFEALNRVQMLAFKFVPFRVGVDEAFSGALAPALALPAAVGVTLAIVRKVRNLFWVAIGLALMAGRADQGLRPKA